MQAAIRALLDEYKRALDDLVLAIESLSSEQLTLVRDELTKDADCKSIQSILAHVVASGKTYGVMINNHLGDSAVRSEKLFHETSEQYVKDLLAMFDEQEALFDQYPNAQIEENDPSKKIKARWGNRYDIEQLLEHAIVHILRHRRQIEKFLNK